jgi:methyl-accepting chemotaxis protein
MTQSTIGRRIAVGYALLLLVLAATASVAIFSLLDTRSGFREALRAQQDRALVGLEDERLTDDASRLALRYLLVGDEAQSAARAERIAEAERLARQLRDSSATAGQRNGWTEAVQLLQAWDAASLAAVSAKRQGRDADALRLTERQMLPARDRAAALIERLVSSERARASATAASASDSATRASWILLIVSVLALVVGSAFAWSVSRGVVRHLRGAIATLASVSSDIVAATMQQTSGAAQEETAIRETSATTDEVRQTVALTTEKARAVARDAQQTADISRDGARAVDEGVRGTREARARMEVLAERILALSEQATAIGDIVTTVNGLAAQSNLLAVNAGIEAAKAGDTGRGFAVVAGEVRGLAAQSKQATAQIREILGEIQRATQAAVMAAEQGVKATEAGEATTGEAGEAIRLLGERLSHSADAAQQILASAQQQTIGMDQVALAMQNIQQASTQNMASTRQVEHAARDLDDLTRQLKLLVAAETNGHARRAARGAHAAG